MKIYDYVASLLVGTGLMITVLGLLITNYNPIFVRSTLVPILGLSMIPVFIMVLIVARYNKKHYGSYLIPPEEKNNARN